MKHTKSDIARARVNTLADLITLVASTVYLWKTLNVLNQKEN